jgi:hypothetical protein
MMPIDQTRGSPESVAPPFRAKVEAGIQYFDGRSPDPDDEETISLETGELMPLLWPVCVTSLRTYATSN